MKSTFYDLYLFLERTFAMIIAIDEHPANELNRLFVILITPLLNTLKVDADDTFNDNIDQEQNIGNIEKIVNNNSWIAADYDGNPWVIIELSEPRYITKIVFGRDIAGGFNDRHPGAVRIQYSNDGELYTDVFNVVKMIQC